MNHRGLSAGGVRANPNNRIQFDFMLDGVRYRPMELPPPGQTRCGLLEASHELTERLHAERLM